MKMLYLMKQRYMTIKWDFKAENLTVHVIRNQVVSFHNGLFDFFLFCIKLELFIRQYYLLHKVASLLPACRNSGYNAKFVVKILQKRQ